MWQELTSILKDYLDKFLERLPDLLMGIFVFLIFYLVAEIQKKISRKYLPRTKLGRQKTQLLNLIIRSAILLVGIVIGLSIMGVNINALIASLGLVGFAMGFALKDYISNFLAGLVILVQEPFKIGDEVKIGDFEGVVKEIESRFTVLETFDGHEVIIPNSKFLSQPVEKFTTGDKNHFVIEIKVPLKNDLIKVKKIITSVLEATEDVLKDPEPHIVVEEFEKEGALLKVNYWSKYSRKEERNLKSKILTVLKSAFEEEGIKW